MTAAKLHMPKFDSIEGSEDNLHNPNCWFARTFPDSAKWYGAGFLTVSYDDQNGLRRFAPAELNEDAWAHALGGDRSLGYRVIFYLPEQRWWFLDPLVGAYCLTTEEKLKALLSNFLIRCSQDVGSLVDIRPLVVDFRKTGILEKVIDRARALHAADTAFFKGEKGHKRVIDGKVVEPTAKPSYEIFAEQSLAKLPTSTLTVTDAWHRYYSFCREHQIPPLTRQDFKSLLAEVIREQFGCGLRRDVPGQNGKAQEGWIGLGLRLPSDGEVGLS